MLCPSAQESHAQGAAGADGACASLWKGQGENFKNLSDAWPDDVGIDRQGSGILPRATESFSEGQLRLLTQAQKHKRASPRAGFTVASHFTIINYDEPLAYSAPRTRCASYLQPKVDAGDCSPIGKQKD